MQYDTSSRRAEARATLVRLNQKLKARLHPQTLEMPQGLPEDFVRTDDGGLSEAEAASRAQSGKANVARDTASRSIAGILASNLFTFFNFLNLALAACLVSVGSYRNLSFLGVVISNTVIGIFQELRARKTVQKLRLMQPGDVRCMRDGQERVLKPEELVEGDVVILPRGAQVPADALVLSGVGAADESMLTGEAQAVSKHRDDWILSGTFITEGQVTAQLVHVGNDSYVSRITAVARKISAPKSALMTDLNRLTRLLSMVLVPLGLMLFIKQHFIHRRALEIAVPQAVASMVGMIPEGLILLTSVALAVGVVRLARKGALVQERYGIETLARADVLCLDKTGTLTSGRMTCQQLIPFEASQEELDLAVSRILSAFPEDVSPTMQALRDRFIASGEQAVAVLPFSSERKCSALTFRDPAHMELMTTYLFGAPSFVLRDRYPEKLREACEAFSAQGLRVLVVAEADACDAFASLPEAVRTLGIVVIEDEIRPEAASILDYFRKQGVDLKIISGDDPRTVNVIARRLGLEGDWADASTLSEDALPEAAERCTVFGRVTPERKRELVVALQSQGHHVAMTGDGVNDIPAFKAADCSIAMASGSEAARKAAQLTLISSDFSVLPDVVLEGRRVINNITRTASLFLIKTLYSFALTLLLIFLPATYPFQPVQLTVISAFTVGIPGFFLSMEANSERIRGHFLRTILANALPGAICVTFCACFFMIMENFGWSVALGSTMSTLAAGGVGLLALLYVSWPLNMYRASLLAAMTGCMIIAFAFFGHLIFLVRPTGMQLLYLMAMLLASALFMRACRGWMKKHRDLL